MLSYDYHLAVIIMKQLIIALTDEERQALEKVRDRHPKPYMRERATAILKVADGRSVNWVAQHACLSQDTQKLSIGGLRAM